MKKYRVKREVPWGSILAFLRNRLKVRMAELDFIQEEAEHRAMSGVMLGFAEERMEQAYNAYVSLRAFLGYCSSTAIEKEAEKRIKKAE